MMDRRAFNGVLAGGLLLTPMVVNAQPSGKIYSIGWLDLAGGAGSLAMLDALRDGLRSLGWIEGQNVTIEARFADGSQDRLAALADELIALKVDVIVTASTRAAQAAKKATAAIPIVMAGASDPVALGLVRSLAAPGENVTGLTHNPGAGFPPKMVQLLQEAAPGLARLAVLWGGPTIADEAQMMGAIRAGAPGLGLVVVDGQAREASEIPKALAAIARQRPDGLLAFPTTQNSSRFRAIAEFALANRLPSISGDSRFVTAGGLMSYWVNWIQLRRHAAAYVDKILRGAKPGSLPIEQPARFELVINLTTAKALGLTMPPSLLLRADQLVH
jgi:putative tryptophan/tyrosine transport system substrate-binding protein